MTINHDPFDIGKQAREFLAAQDKREEERRLRILNDERTALLDAQKATASTPQGLASRDAIDARLSALDKQANFIKTEHAQRRRSYSW